MTRERRNGSASTIRRSVVAALLLTMIGVVGTRAEQPDDWLGPVPTAPPEIIARFADWQTMLGTSQPTVLANVDSSCVPPEVEAIGKSTWHKTGRGTSHERWEPGDGADNFPLTRLTFSPGTEIHVVGIDGRPRTIRFNVVETADTPGMFSVSLCSYRLIEDARRVEDPPEGIPEHLDFGFRQVVLVSHRPLRRGFSAKAVPPRFTFRVDSRKVDGAAFPASLLEALKDRRIIAFLERDRLASDTLSYERDFSSVVAQNLVMTIGRDRGRQHYVSAYWNFETPLQAVRAWTVLRRTGRSLDPVHLSKLEGDWVPMVDFYPTLIADLDGDGVDEMIGQREMHEGAGTGIMTWLNGAPVYVSHGHARFTLPPLPPHRP